MTDVLWVTSFNPELYEASGRRLIETFRRVQKTGKILVCGEGGVECDADYRYDLDGDEFLRTWLHANRDVIPDYLGGLATECQCPERKERHGRHKFRCHWQWMNRNASRWFRKVAALRHAVVEHKAKITVWLDADTYFVRSCPEKFLADLLRGTAMFYFRGHRDAAESGIIGLDTSRPDMGAALVSKLCDRYTTRAYRQYPRWDDGYQLARVTEATPRPKSVDLVHKTKWKGKTNDVIPTTEISRFIRHEKGRHGTKLDIMK